MLEVFVDNGFILRSFCFDPSHRSWVDVGWVFCRFEVDLGSIWDGSESIRARFRIDSGSIRFRFVILAFEIMNENRKALSEESIQKQKGRRTAVGRPSDGRRTGRRPFQADRRPVFFPWGGLGVLSPPRNIRLVTCVEKKRFFQFFSPGLYDQGYGLEK